MHEPVRAQDVVQTVRASQGRFLTVSERDIVRGRDELAHQGFYVETTSAIVWNALEQMIALGDIQQMPEPVAVVLTGSGLKTA